MEELIQLRVNLLKASRFIRVHNAPMDADQIIENSLQIVNSLIERASAEPVNDASALPIHSVSVSVSRCKTCGHPFTDDVCCKDCIDLKID